MGLASLQKAVNMIERVILRAALSLVAILMVACMILCFSSFWRWGFSTEDLVEIDSKLQWFARWPMLILVVLAVLFQVSARFFRWRFLPRSDWSRNTPILVKLSVLMVVIATATAGFTVLLTRRSVELRIQDWAVQAFKDEGWQTLAANELELVVRQNGRRYCANILFFLSVSLLVVLELKWPVARNKPRYLMD